MTHERARQLIDTYAKAWETQDADLILTIFSEDASYNDPKMPVNVGRTAIRDYWIKKVQGEQRDVAFKLLNLWVDGDTVIAEWNARFVDVPRDLHIDMNEVAIFGVKGDVFGSLREYYTTVKAPL